MLIAKPLITPPEIWPRSMLNSNQDSGFCLKKRIAWQQRTFPCCVQTELKVSWSYSVHHPRVFIVNVCKWNDDYIQEALSSTQRGSIILNMTNEYATSYPCTKTLDSISLYLKKKRKSEGWKKKKKWEQNREKRGKREWESEVGRMNRWSIEAWTKALLQPTVENITSIR